MRHALLVDVDTVNPAEIVRQVIIDDAAGTTDIQQRQLREIGLLQVILADPDDRISIALRSRCSVLNTEGFSAE